MTSFVKHNKGLSVFVTGSNSKCLSDDIRKAFKEMAVIIKLRPLSFSQVRKTMPEYEIDDYLTYGSLPVVLKEKPENRFPLLKKPLPGHLSCRHSRTGPWKLFIRDRKRKDRRPHSFEPDFSVKRDGNCQGDHKWTQIKQDSIFGS